MSSYFDTGFDLGTGLDYTGSAPPVSSTGYDLGSFDVSSYLPSFYNPEFNWSQISDYSAPMSGYSAPAEQSLWDKWSDGLSNIKLKDLGAFGLGALSAWGSYKDRQSQRDLAKAKIAADQADRELGSGDDFAKMHALAQIIQARQGINLDPSLAYAQAVRKQMGISPEGAAEFAGVDIGGPMKVGMSSSDRLDAINRSTNVNFAEGGPVFGRLAGIVAQNTGASDPADDHTALAMNQMQQLSPQVGGWLGRSIPAALQQMQQFAPQQNTLPQVGGGGGGGVDDVVDGSGLMVSQPPAQPSQVGGMGGLGLAFIRANPQFMAARKAYDQRQQQADGSGISNFLARRLAQQLEARKLLQPRFQQEQMRPRQFGGLSAIVSRDPQLMAAMQRRQQLAHGGDVQGLLAGSSPGQADDVNASLSHGEYVFDADTVAALGDGNTEAGARELDRMREAIRQHKRSAPASKIPPPSKGALAYLKGAK